MTDTVTGPGSQAAESSVAPVGDALRERADDVALVLDSLSEVLLGEDDLPAALQRIVDLAVRTVPGCHAAGITLLSGQQPTTAACTDQRTLAVDRRQYDEGEGPCLDAATHRRINRVDVEEAAERWPGFAAAAREIGVRSFLAAPVAVHETPMGALNLYSRSADGFSAVDEAFIGLFTAQAGIALAGFRRNAEARALAEQMREAMASRAVIEQAKGVLVERHRTDPETAFAMLRRESQNRNVKLRSLAEALVAGATLAAGGETG
ncbi:MAG TPA: GAF and ANTAR domain-containing protein [Jiangellales bacterium]|nr:GAF and ANTAR domain-containing protein [Jiangellales bacterium]